MQMGQYVLFRLQPFRIKKRGYRLMYRGAAYADVMRYQRCIDLWRRVLEIRIEKDSILYTDTCFTAQALVRLMLDHNKKSIANNEDNAKQRFHDVVATFKLMTNDLIGIIHFFLE